MFSFDLKSKALVDDMRDPHIYQFNMAMNLALLSNDISVIRRFFRVQIPQYFKDEWLAEEVSNFFMAYYQSGQAFTYFGIIPMIVKGKVNLVSSAGFKCDSNDKVVDDILNTIKDGANLQQRFVEGAYLESGLGDFAYRLSYDPAISDKPLIDVIEPQFLEVNYKHNQIKSFAIKEVAKDDPSIEMHEVHYKNSAGFVCIAYMFYNDGVLVSNTDEAQIKYCLEKLNIQEKPKDLTLPFRDFLIIFKKNANNSRLYKGERGVPDIQGLASIEDALTESVSDLIDAIRKGGVREYVDESLIPQDEKGNDLRLNHFNKTVTITRGQTTPGEGNKLWQVVQGDIRWEAYTRTIQNLMSVAINKAGLSPTTIGLTGLESINSSAESQDAREKTSMRTRAVALDSWRITLRDLLNRYMQVQDYIDGEPIIDYSRLINITFNEYTNPTLENITNVLARQVQTGLKSQVTAIKDLNEGMTDEEAQREYEQIKAEQTPTADSLPPPNKMTLTHIPLNMD